MKTPTRMALVVWATVGALAGAMTLGMGHAQAGDAVTKASQPYIAPLLPSFEKSQHRGRIGVGEAVQDQGSSMRKDLIKKRTIADIIDRSKPSDGSGGSWIGGGNDAAKPPETFGLPVDTQPISLSSRSVADDTPPACPEPSGFALAGIGLASLVLYGRRGKR